MGIFSTISHSLAVKGYDGVLGFIRRAIWRTGLVFEKEGQARWRELCAWNHSIKRKANAKLSFPYEGVS